MDSPKKRIITIAGRPGSGKSTTSKAVAAQLGYDHFSSGDLFREIGAKRGLDVFDTNKAAESDSEIDRLVDERLRQIGKTGDSLAIDSRTAWHWMLSSFKVFLDLDLETAAKRIIANMDDARRAKEHISDDPHEYALRLKDRLASETARYQSLYQIDPYDMSNYDLVIDTSESGPEQVVERVMESYKKWLNAG